MVRATVVASLGAAVVGYAFCTLAALAAWAFAAHGDATVDDALRAGSFAFLAIHGAPLEIGDARFSLPLLGLMLLPIIILSNALSRAWRRQIVSGRNEMLTLAALGSAPYLIFAIAVGVFWSSADASVPIVPAVIWVLLVCFLAAGWAWWGTVRLSPRADVGAPDFSIRTRRVFGGALVALLILFVVATLTLVTVLALSARDIWLVAESLESGVVGLLVLIALAIGWLPTGVVWVTAYLLGPGFALGDSTLVSPFVTSFGELPALPWFAAAPQSSSDWYLMFLLVPVLAGAATAGVLGSNLARQHPLKWWREAMLSVLLVAGVMWALGWLTRGSLGEGRLLVFGSQPMSLFFAVLLLCGAGATALPLTHWLVRRFART